MTINARKFDGQIRRSWKCELAERSGSLLIFVGLFDREVKHQNLGIIRRGTVSYEYYWLDQWFNIFRFHEPDGSFRNFYCNINMPPTFNNDVLDYIDLDIDVVIWPDFSLEILDLDEFEDNAALFRYPSEIKKKALAGLLTLQRMIALRKFPFDFK